MFFDTYLFLSSFSLPHRLLKAVKLMKQLQVSSTLYFFIVHWVNLSINKKAVILWGLWDMKMLTVTSSILPM